MFTPFVLFHFKMILGLRKMKRRYVVFQHAENTAGATDKIKILLTDYASIGLAQIHLNALQHPEKAILDLENEQHRERIMQMLQQTSKYTVYAPFMEDSIKVEKKLSKEYKTHIRNYILKHTTWRIGGDNAVNPKLELIFGEVFVKLRYGNESKEFKLADLEEYK